MKGNILFICLGIGALAYILYKFLLPCCRDGRGGLPHRTPRPGPSPGSGWSTGSGHLTRQQQQQRNPEPQPRQYGWENEYFRRDPDPQEPRASSAFSGQQSWSSSSSGGCNSRGGSLNFEPMRRSTGYGDSTVR